MFRTTDDKQILIPKSESSSVLPFINVPAQHLSNASARDFDAGDGVLSLFYEHAF